MWAAMLAAMLVGHWVDSSAVKRADLMAVMMVSLMVVY
jgi:hypothetical protein